MSFLSLPLNLQSQVSDKIAVRFYNFSNVEADITWINFQGDHEKYCTLKPKQFIDVDTYSRHYWIFSEKHTKKFLLANNKPYFLADEQKYPKQIHSRNARYCVCVSQAFVPTLKALAISYLSRYLRNCSDVKYLEIPKTLKKEIIVKIHYQNNAFHSSNGDKINCEKNLDVNIQVGRE